MILAIDLEWACRRNDLYRCTEIGVAEVTSAGAVPRWYACAPELRREHYEAFLDCFPAPFVWLGHNVQSDLTRFRKDLAALMLPAPFLEDTRDTLPLCRERWPGRRNTLVAACRRARVGGEWRRHAHTAMADAVMCGDLYRRLAPAGVLF